MTTFAPHRDNVESFVDCMHGGADKDALSGILAEDVVLYKPRQPRGGGHRYRHDRLRPRRRGPPSDRHMRLGSRIGDRHRPRGRNIARDRARGHIAGFCIGQDISERTAQMKGATPQFSLAKSHRAFSPIGPWLTTPDEITASTDLAIATVIDGETVQHGRTSQMIFGIDELVAYLSRTCELKPGDLIFSGTPAGVGYSRTPPRFLTTGSVIHSSIEGLGQLR